LRLALPPTPTVPTSCRAHGDGNDVVDDTVRLTAEDVVVAPRSSVARAVNE
jgi:hypothetical protein